MLKCVIFIVYYNLNYTVLFRNTNFEKKLNYKQSEKIISKDKQKCMKQYENEM